MQRGCQGEDCGGCGGQKCPDRRRRSCVFLGRLETSGSINANRQEMNTTTKSPARPSACFKSRSPSKNLLPTNFPQLLVRGGVTFEARKTEWAHAKQSGRTMEGGRAHIVWWRLAAIVPSQPRKQNPQQDRRGPWPRAICADDRSRARHPAQPPQPSDGRNAIICATTAQTAERAARAMEAFMHRSFFTVK